jgi:RHS repeat-associated protein
MATASQMPVASVSSGAFTSYYRARYYDPQTGRFVSEDPIGFIGTINFYSYAINNPVLFVDPSDLWHTTGRPADPKIALMVSVAAPT